MAKSQPRRRSGTPAARPTARKSKPKAPARKATRGRRTAPPIPRGDPHRDQDGWITHTDLASDDPAATKAWCADVLGWAFRPPLPSPGGDVHLFVYSDKGGGAVRAVSPPERPGSIPYVHVADVDAAYAKALAKGAVAMMSPTTVMEGVRIAIVRAPGGVPIGFSGPSLGR